MNKAFVPLALLVYSIVLIILFCFLLPDFNLIPFPYNMAGVLIAFTGFTIMGNSRDKFRKYETTLAIEKSSHLITDGVFAWSRNPMYLGMFFLLFGIGVCFMNLFSILTPYGFVLVVNGFIIPKEEKLMKEAFGQEYLVYKSRVRKWV
ncbi:MAG: isoprenylcysteine carboxylmethyltransferase family protein [Bacteroidales bacterium]|nr:isoprenylcysteine carboxylmethyltransferase family protein [Bacteroidales bacterium]MCF8458814.1 isoprenylcysteine carboxylmethyltransferase family protein [Bacteroidales bacterium]